MTDDPVPWLTDGRDAWLTEVAGWVGAHAHREPGEVALDIVKERPWGAVLRMGSGAADVYFKAVGPHGRHEARVLSDLTTRGWAGLAPEVLAVDEARGWILMADHGAPIRELAAGEQIAVLDRLLPVYAEMQRATVDLVPGWLEAGTPDRGVAGLPERLEALLSGQGQGGPLPIDDGERVALSELLADLRAVCDDLAATPSPTAIDHSDIHGTNVLVDDGEACVIDWGDACITHPFASPFVPLLFLVPLLPTAERRAATLRLRDAYLEPWGAARDVREAFGLAVWCGYVVRALSVDHQSLGASPRELAGCHDEIVGLLRRWRSKRAELAHPDDIVQAL